MTVSKEVKLMELSDAKIFKLLTDPSGGTATYDTAIDVPGILKVTITPTVKTLELYGDSELKDVYQRTQKIEIDGECTIFSLDAYKIMVGGTVTQHTGTPNDVTYSFTSSDDSPPYFKLGGKWRYTGISGGVAHFWLYKLKITTPPSIELNDSSGNFGTMKFKASALPLASNGNWYDIIFYDGAKELV